MKSLVIPLALALLLGACSRSEGETNEASIEAAANAIERRADEEVNKAIAEIEAQSPDASEESQAETNSTESGNKP